MDGTIRNSQTDPYLREVQHTVNFRVLFHLMNLSAHKEVHPQVNALAHMTLNTLAAGIGSKTNDAIAAEMVRRIDRFIKEPEEFKVVPVPKIPDGSPIGSSCFHVFDRIGPYSGTLKSD